MTNITPPLIQNIAVKTVEGFLNDGISLSEGLAKQASAYELNSDQIQRCVEASNSICYLKMLQLGTDRTVEFPVADYNSVMSHVTLPDMAKAASAKPTELVKAKTGNATLRFDDFEKAASVTDFYEGIPLRVRQNMLFKEAATNKRELEELSVRSDILVTQLTKLAKEVARDESGMDKLASVASIEDFKPLSVLVTGSVQPYRDLNSLGLLKNASVSKVKELHDLYKEAQEVMTEMIQRREAQASADTMLRKEALFGSKGEKTQPTASLKAKSTMAGAATGAGAAEKVTAAAKTSGTILGGLAKGTGMVASKAVKTVASVPITAAKAILKNPTAIAGAGLDATAYNPGVDKTTGRSNDVWAALNN